MDIATWNVNSVRARLPRAVSWLERRKPDVVCLQETKVVDDDFPREAMEALGYECIVFGQKTYNGVAILTRLGATDVVRGLPGDISPVEARIVGARIAGARIIGVYAPNGGDVDRPAYQHKLDWYRRLRAWLDETLDPGDDVVLCGDLNVAPEDRDVWDPLAWRGKILFSAPEKEALAAVVGWGLTDLVRLHHPEAGLYTWWDYRAGAFHRGWGLRIDHILGSASMARRCTGAEVDRDERRGEKPSDHAPVLATFAPA